jgi:hypothetical protein
MVRAPPRRSVEEFPQDRSGSLGYRLIGEEVCAYPQGIGGGAHSGHSREQAKIVNITYPGRKRLHREDMLRRSCHHPQPRMIEHAAFPGIILPGDINARLLVQPPRRQAKIFRDPAGLLQHDAMGTNLASTSRVTRLTS